jgi:hypothetical protein
VEKKKLYIQYITQVVLLARVGGKWSVQSVNVSGHQKQQKRNLGKHGIGGMMNQTIIDLMNCPDIEFRVEYSELCKACDKICTLRKEEG